MTSQNGQNGANSEKTFAPPAIRRDAQGRIPSETVADIIEWFLNYDERVAIVRHPRVEEIFQWKQQTSRAAGEEVFEFPHAEDRFAVGVFQALAANDSERELRDWICQLLNALEESSKTNEEISGAYNLEVGDASLVEEARKIPAAATREIYLTCCWLETLCTAEIRVLGWLYQNLYERPFNPNGH